MNDVVLRFHILSTFSGRPIFLGVCRHHAADPTLLPRLEKHRFNNLSTTTGTGFWASWAIALEFHKVNCAPVAVDRNYRVPPTPTIQNERTDRSFAVRNRGLSALPNTVMPSVMAQLLAPEQIIRSIKIAKHAVIRVIVLNDRSAFEGTLKSGYCVPAFIGILRQNETGNR